MPMKCSDGEIWDGSRNKCIKDNAPQFVGDGKQPNKYYVSSSNDYRVMKKKGYMTSISEIDDDFVSIGKTVAVFDSYREAKEYAENIPLGIDEEMRRVIIEDRLSGELYAAEVVETLVSHYDIDRYENVQFTRNEIEKSGRRFV